MEYSKAPHVRRTGLSSSGQWLVIGLALIGLSSLLTGCGFHLQGTSPLPKGIDAMHIVYSDPYRVETPPLVTALQDRLRRQGLLGEMDAPAELDILSLSNGQRLMSVSPVDGGAAEYELTTQVRFSYRVNGADQLSDESLSVTRAYSVDQSQRLSADQEQRALLERMQQELANLILLRVAQANDALVQPSSDGA